MRFRCAGRRILLAYHASCFPSHLQSLAWLLTVTLYLTRGRAECCQASHLTSGEKANTPFFFLSSFFFLSKMPNFRRVFCTPFINRSWFLFLASDKVDHDLSNLTLFWTKHFRTSSSNTSCQVLSTCFLLHAHTRKHAHTHTHTHTQPSSFA